MHKKNTYPQRQMGKHAIVTRKILLFLASGFTVATTHYFTTAHYARDLSEGFSELEDLFFPKEEKIPEEKIRKSIYNLKKGGYIKYRTSKDKTKFHFELTKKGKEIVESYTLGELKLSKNMKWDEKWRFVMFDIPEKSRYARNMFRDKLKNLEFFRVQQSVWVYPYSCEKEIDFLAEFLYVKPFVLIFTGKINNDWALKIHFKKLGFKL